MTGLRSLVPAELPTVAEISADPLLIDSVAQDLMASAVNMDDLDAFVYSDSATEQWIGDAAEAYRNRIRQVGHDAREISEILRQVAQAVSSHSDEIAAILSRRDLTAEDQRTFNDVRLELLTAIDSAGSDASDDLNEDLRARALNLTRERESIDSDKRQIATDLDNAEQTILSVMRNYSDITALLAGARPDTDLATQALSKSGSPTSESSTVEQITAWWSALSEDEQEAVLAAQPDLIGNSDGIPFAVRDRANRLALETDLAALEWRERYGRVLPGDEQKITNACAVRDALDWGGEQIDPVTGETLVPMLYMYDSTAFGGDGKAGIAFGNSDTADNVSIIVPGIRTRATSAQDYTEKAYNIYDSTRLSDPTKSVCSMMWIGYDSPSDSDIYATATESRAEAGGKLLSKFVDGLRATRQSTTSAHITVVAHSYGSTTASHAASDSGLDVDELILIGSPGAGGDVDNASELGIDTGHVWVGRNSMDVVAAIGSEGSFGLKTLNGMGLGNDPAEDKFGATRFAAESITRGDHVNFSDHSKYFEPGSESLYNIGAIVADQDEQVLTAPHTWDPKYTYPIDPESSREPTRQTHASGSEGNG